MTKTEIRQKLERLGNQATVGADPQAPTDFKFMWNLMKPQLTEVMYALYKKETM